MRLLFLQPLRIFKRWPVPEDFTGLLSRVPTLAFAQLAGAVPGHRFDLLDGLAHDASLAELGRRARVADLVLLNAHSSIGATNVEANVRFLAEAAPDTPIVVGGHHATQYDREWLERGVRFVVRGEGENTLAELLEAFARGGGFEGIEGLSFRAVDGAVQRNKDRALEPSLDSFPFPDMDLFDPASYSISLPGEGYSTTFETSRGCTHDCAFCTTRSMWRSGQRFKSAERVLAELRELHRRGFRKLWLADDNFGAAPERDAAIYEGMLREKLDFRIAAMVRADSVTSHPELWKLAARAGFTMGFVGFESVSERSLAAWRKGISPDLPARASMILRRAGIFVVGFLIVGYPEETDDEVSQVLAAATNLADYPVISIFEPRRGSDAFEKCRARNDMPTADMFTHNSVDFVPSRRHLLKRYRRFFTAYLAHPRQMRKLLLGSPTERCFFRRVYGNLVHATLDVTPAGLAHPWQFVRDIRE
jgi:anaerobic magnesium-protoporphyrin IX monomethyl ester cyclase